MKLNILTELTEIYTAITEADMERAARSLHPAQDKETALGVVHSLDARRMWAAQIACEAKSCKALVAAKFDAMSEEEMRELHASSSYYHDLAELARDAFWLEAKSDISGAVWFEGVGLRDGWMLVASAPANPLGDMMKILRIKEI